MPKILIKEFDKTSAGTPGSYSNYSVLITGYRGRSYSIEDKIQPDSNGVYEFSSKQDFIDTVGESGIELKEDGKVIECHYGNSMAIELLSLGYPIIYKPIEHVSDMVNANFWEDFRDKASYDFRFVSHGLLSTCHDEATHKTLTDRLTEIESIIARFKQIETDVSNKEIPEGSTKELELTKEYLRVIADKGAEAEEVEGVKAYEGVGEGYEGFADGAGNNYGSYELAAAEFGTTNGKVETAKAYTDQQALIDAHELTNISKETFNNINEQIAMLASYRVNEQTSEPYANATGRGDCIALIELDENDYVVPGSSSRPEKLIIDAINVMANIGGIGENGEYCALTVPSVYYSEGKDEATGEEKFMKMPGAFHYLACFMNSLGSGFAEWYAAAGYTRGVGKLVHHTSVKLGEIAINALEPRYIEDQSKQPQFACNVIANFRGSYYLWGNRTAAKLKEKSAGGDLTAKHFLNIRQLSTTIKKQLYVACRRFTFDPNSDTLWFNFVNAITPTLDVMKADQGIRDYKILKVFTDKKATLKAKIRIIPIEAVEDFDLEISLEDSFGETSAVVNG